MTGARAKITSARTVGAFMNGRACSDTLFHVLNRAFDGPRKTEERACMPLAGGILQHGYQCGMLWGASLAAGAQAWRQFGPGPRAEARAIAASQRVVDAFRALHHTTDCYDITQLNSSSTTVQKLTYFLLKGGTVGCFRMAARFAPVAFREIEAALAAEPEKDVAPPVSCAALLARRMGASEHRAVTAAGLAGGIGLSGGGCGALGAAIWITAMRSVEGGGKVDWKDPRAAALIERFLQATHYEFTCDRTVGRRFEGVEDHAGYLRNGGCARVFDALAAG